MRQLLFLIALPFLISSCSPSKAETILSSVPTPSRLPMSTETSEEAMIATEQAMAAIVKTEFALTMVAQPTFTPMPTFTPIPADLPTLTPISNSTPARAGAFFAVSSDVLGPRYEIENACYFDTQAGWERYEIYAGAIAGSGDEYSAQGVVVIRIFRAVEKDGNPVIELVDTQELLTLGKVGPLRLSSYDEGNCHDDWMSLRTPLDFMWIMNPASGEFFQDVHRPPLARIEVGESTQLAELGSYCWNGGCLDGPGITTSSIPLTMQSTSVARLRLPLDEAPSSLTLSAMLVSPPGALQYEHRYGDNADWSYEAPGRNLLDLGILPLKRKQDIQLSLEPGYYVLRVLATWHAYGDVKYGFLIEVQN
jgi:hypothetical protein